MEGLEMEDAGMFYCHLVYFTAIRYILWLFGFMVIWYVVQRKIWQPWFQRQKLDATTFSTPT
jgi:hypothetical protein